MTEVRSNWSRAEVGELYGLPLMELLHRAQTAHRQEFTAGEVQVSRLLSIKTGGCPEDCGYCSQSVHYETGVEAQPLMAVPEVIAAASEAKAGGATRFCMGAAWRHVREGREFEQVLEMVREVSALGMETCCTLGMLNADQARRLKEAGLYAYNHNLDTSPEHYGNIISTRTFTERLRTIEHVRQAGITVCTGVILGMGESEADHVGALLQLAALSPHPESVTVNRLIPQPGTPLADAPPLDPLVLVRFIAVARLLMPRSMVRLSAGRTALSPETHLLCFYAGANSIFAGDTLLTSPNPELSEDASLFEALHLKAMPLPG